MNRRFASVALVIVAVALSSCTAAPAPIPSPTTSPPTLVAPDLEIPPVAAGEVARVVADGEPLRVEASELAGSDRDIDYVVEAACVADSVSTVVVYQLVATDGILSTGSIACDGSTYRNSGTNASSSDVRVVFEDVPIGVTRAYARLIPAAG